MTALARLGLAGRMIVIILMVVVPLSVASLVGAWQARSRDVGVGFRNPLVDQIAAIVDLVAATPPERRSLVLRALNSTDLRVAVSPRMPEPLATSFRSNAMEWLVDRFRVALDYRPATIHITPAGDGNAVGEIQIVVPDGAEFIVVELRRPAFANLFGFPTGFFAGLLGIGLAGLAIAAIMREARPLASMPSRAPSQRAAPRTSAR
jgi:two-component system, OmpR family, osmolarity sensor histidine kinase EnvZ